MRNSLDLAPTDYRAETPPFNPDMRSSKTPSIRASRKTVKLVRFLLGCLRGLPVQPVGCRRRLVEDFLKLLPRDNGRRIGRRAGDGDLLERRFRPVKQVATEKP
jgi:hypothetical protein